MAKQSPHKLVKSKHGTKAKLAEKVLDFLTAPEGEEKDVFEARIRTLSNAKLQRLFDAHGLSRERLANQRRKQAQAKQAPPAVEPPVPEHIAEQRKREKEAQQDAVMEQVRKKLEAQFGVGAVQVFTRRSE